METCIVIDSRKMLLCANDIILHAVMNWILCPPHLYIEILTPSTSACDLI